MKILLVEDEEKNIESAKMQLKDHDLIIIRSYLQLTRLRNELWETFNLVLTDMNLRFGDEKQGWSVEKKYNENDLVPCGTVVAMNALSMKIPCVMVTDSNGHIDPVGLLFENKCGYLLGESKFMACTRPSWIETRFGPGKDWLKAIRNSELEFLS